MVKEIDKFKKELKDRNKKKKKGFTLVELLAVFVILAVIAGIVISSMDSIKGNVTVNVYKESVKSAINAAQNYYSENGESTDLENGISIFSKDLSIENKNQYKSGSIVYNDATGKLEARNISDGSYCANGPIDNLTIIEGDCPSTDIACFDYTVSAGKVTITDFDYSNTSCYGDVNIPSQIEGYPVTKIGFGAFADIDASQSASCNTAAMSYFYDSEKNESGIVSLLSNTFNKPATLLAVSEADYMDYCIPYTTYYVYDNSGCSCGTDYDLEFNYIGDRGYNITGVTMPSTVTYIDNLAFAKTGLSGVNFDSLPNLNYIGDTSFLYTNLSSVDLSGLTKLQTIGFYAFAMSGVENVNLTDIPNLREIRSGAFNYNQITSVDFTDSNNIVHIGSEAFEDNQINNIIINNLTKIYSIGYDAFCDNPFYYNNNYPQVNNLTNLNSSQLGNACLYDGGL
jgi:prepilin-type N-terminal cleavage/methylation domain-containing protein